MTILLELLPTQSFCKSWWSPVAYQLGDKLSQLFYLFYSLQLHFLELFIQIFLYIYFYIAVISQFVGVFCRINSFIICYLPVKRHSGIKRATKMEGWVQSRSGHTEGLAWMTVLAACPALWSVLMDVCMEKVHAVFTAKVAARPTPQSMRKWIAQTIRDTPKGVQSQYNENLSSFANETSAWGKCCLGRPTFLFIKFSTVVWKVRRFLQTHGSANIFE